MKETAPQLTDRQIIAMGVVLQETLLNDDVAVNILANPRPRLRQLGLNKVDIQNCIAYGDYIWDIITVNEVKDEWAYKKGEAITIAPDLTPRQIIAMNVLWQETLLNADAGAKSLQHPRARLKQLGLGEDDIKNIMDYIFYVFSRLLERSLEAWQEDYEDKA